MVSFAPNPRSIDLYHWFNPCSWLKKFSPSSRPHRCIWGGSKIHNIHYEASENTSDVVYKIITLSILGIQTLENIQQTIKKITWLKAKSRINIYIYLTLWMPWKHYLDAWGFRVPETWLRDSCLDISFFVSVLDLIDFIDYAHLFSARNLCKSAQHWTCPIAWPNLTNVNTSLQNRKFAFTFKKIKSHRMFEKHQKLTIHNL